MAVCYYITSHGFGHAVRSTAIINQIPEEIQVIVRSEVSPALLSEEIRRPYDLAPASFDCGAIQKDGFTIDPAATLAACAEVARANQVRLESEIEFLRGRDVAAVVSDIASFPLAVAGRAGIPGIAVGNFDWSEIYKPFLPPKGAALDLLRRIRAEYARASLCLRLPFSCPMECLPHRMDVPLVCRKPKWIRSELSASLDLDPEARWVALYLGQYPTDFDGSRLGRLAGFRFLAMGKRAAAWPNVAVANPARFRACDVLASCDVALGKPGYATIADCIAGNTPLVYALPTNFAEALALDAELQAWGRAVRIDRDILFHGDLRGALEAAMVSEAKKEYDLSGAEAVAETIVKVRQGG